MQRTMAGASSITTSHESQRYDLFRDVMTAGDGPIAPLSASSINAGLALGSCSALSGPKDCWFVAVPFRKLWARLWKHHFGKVLYSSDQLGLGEFAAPQP
jgi:hypothetical protein